MSKYIVSYYDNDGHIQITEKDSSLIQNVLGYDDEVASKINSIISIEDCIVKFDQNRNLIILESKDASTKIVFRFSEEILEKPELSDIKNAILHNAEKNGVIDITDKEIISQTPSRKSKKSGSVVKTFGTIMLYASIVITPFAFLSSHNRENIEPSLDTVYLETVKPKKSDAMMFYGAVDPSVNESFGPIDLNEEKEEENQLDGSFGQTSNLRPKKHFFVGIESIEGESKEDNGPTDEVKEENIQVQEPIQSEEVPSTSSSYVFEHPNVDSMPSMYLEFDDLSETDKAIKCKELYYDIIKKYSHKYGLDPDLVLGMATQERGIHSNEIDSGGGIGLMQVQYSVWVNNSITYYELNDETGEYEKKTMTITDEKLRDLETNIQIGCLILQDCLISSHYNIPIAVQMYNMGIGEIYKMLDNYRATNGLSRNDILDNPKDTGWLGYRISRYLEAINKWVYDNNFTVINVKTGEAVSIEFTNENEVALHSR